MIIPVMKRCLNASQNLRRCNSGLYKEWKFIDVIRIRAMHNNYPRLKILHQKMKRKELDRIIIGLANLVTKIKFCLIEGTRRI